MTATMMSLSLCFSTKSSNNRRESQSNEPEFEKFLEKHSTYCKRRWSRKKKAGTEVWFGQSQTDIPVQEIGDLSSEIFASYSGPDKGLYIVPGLEPAPIEEITVQPVQNVAKTETGEKSDNSEKDANGNGHNTEPDPVATEPDLSGDQTQPAVIRSRRMSQWAGLEDAGADRWNVKSRKAYGISMSLYEQHPINGKISGEPIADSFGICSRKNNSIMIAADGVNWGEKSMLAARCAVYGSMRYINHRLFHSKPITNTNEAFQLLLRAVDKAHDTIIYYGGGQTTLCLALVLPIKDSHQFAICIVNVGDSLAYVFSKYHGIREITTGSHDIQTERDIRDAGGAVGPVHGNDPELHNLTCSMTVADPGDIVYLTTDGISDNFDPVVTKTAVAKRRYSNPELQTVAEEGNGDGTTNGNNVAMDTINRRNKCGTIEGKPIMEPHERHQYAVKEMERIIHEFELFTEQPCSAQELCGALLQHVLKLTDPKRKVLENPDLYGKKLKSKDRKRRDSEIMAKLSKSPGKLDHATIIGHEVGVYRGNDDEDYELEELSEDDEETENLSPTDNTVRLFSFDESHFADSGTSHDVARLGKHDSHNNACLPLSDATNATVEQHNKQSLSPDAGRSKKHAKALKNLKTKIRTRFKSPGRSRSSRGSEERTPDKAEKSPKSPSKAPRKYSAEDVAVKSRSRSRETSKSSVDNKAATTSKANPSIIPENYMIKAPIASNSEFNIDQDSDSDKQNSSSLTYVLPEVIPYGIDLEDIMFIDDIGDDAE